MVKKTYKVNGMHCTSCVMVVESDLEDIGVKAACNYAKGTLMVEFDPKKISEKKIAETVAQSGYRLVII